MNGDAQPQGTSDGRKFWMNDCEAVLGIVAVLLIIGSINVFSSSFVLAETNFGTPYFFLRKHGLNLVAGIFFLWLGIGINYHRWRTFMPLIFSESSLRWFWSYSSALRSMAHNAGCR